MNPQQQHKPGQPVVGFNHNIGYKGKTFHVQTEDSGPQHGHIITHIFLGGNILASVKSSYADVLPTLQAGEIFATVRKLMEDQHKSMMKGLLAGQHDAEIARRTGTSHYEPGVLAGGERAPGLLVGGDKTPGPNAKPPSPATEPRQATPGPASRPPTLDKPQATPGPAARPPSVPAPPRPAASSVPPPARPAQTTPPPARPAPLASAISRPAPPKPMPSSVPAPRPAAAAPAPAPAPAATTLFGDGLLSDKSLDEVILSYLAADLDQKR